MDLLDLMEARGARDEALERVAENAGPDWMQRALAALRRIEFGAGLTGEDLRFLVLDHVEPPHHHNAWGALIRSAIKSGTIRRTGEWRNMKSRKSHARMTPVYRRTS